MLAQKKMIMVVTIIEVKPNCRLIISRESHTNEVD